MSTALFINGIYDSVLAEIWDAQESRRGGDSFLQPYKGQVIRILEKQSPTPEHPIRLYISTTEQLNQICYIAEIVKWEDKREISARRRSVVRNHLEQYQPVELHLFDEIDEIGQRAVNLVTIRNLKRLETLHSTSILRKVSDGVPLKRRTRSGGWSEVHDLGDLIQLPTTTLEQYESELTSEVHESAGLSDSVLLRRLAAAAKIPERIQVISIGYRRNPDVIVAVLRRAKGICERCKKPAPFLRRSDGSPYLEVHHWVPLSQGGEDTTKNAAALCPNCHREGHFG